MIVPFRGQTALRRVRRKAVRLFTSTALRTSFIMNPLAALLADQRGMWGLPAAMGIDPGGTYVKRIQTVLFIMNGVTSQNATIVSVNTSNAVIFWNGQHALSDSQLPPATARVTLTNATTVTATTDTAASNMRISCTVIEFVPGALASAVQYGTITITSGNTSNTASISSVSTSQAVVLFLGCSTTGTTISRGFANIELTNSTTVTANRGDNSSQMTVGFVVCEFASKLVKSIQQVAHTSSATGLTFTDTISSVATDNTILLWQGISVSTNVMFFSIELTNSTTVTLTRLRSSSATRTVKYTVLEFQPGALNQPVQRGIISVASGQVSKTASITKLSGTNGFVNFCQYATTGNSMEPTTMFYYMKLADSSTVEVVRAYIAPSSNTATCSYEAVEFM